MASIELKNVYKNYGAVSVLQDINISAEDKEFLVLVGPSGCGKSTLLRMIAGLEETCSGSILLNNSDITCKPPQDRDLAMVFQSYALYPHMTVRQNIAYPLKIRKKTATQIDQMVQTAAETLQLTDYLDRYPRNLSGGQRQRVAMGRAIVRSPKAFLFDEPLSNLDAKLRTHMRSEIRALHQKLGVTSVYVTHDQVEAMTMADKIVVMKSGNIEQIGTPLELFDQPASVFVASFLGAPTMNIFDAIVTETQDGNLTTDTVSGRLNFDKNMLPGVSAGAHIKLGIRPQHIIPGDSLDKKSIKIEGRIKVAEQTGCETNLVVQSVGQSDWIIQTRDRTVVQTGDQLPFILPFERLHIFDDSGQSRLN